ncbi:MAG: YabP/YqfC family sporulation protein [Clostridia bacterium]|jgi:sporulation protein YabP|nr:YabP/YqfC family sporulation protein [Clostridia bacterium]
MTQKKHTLTLDSRNVLNITAVDDVISFDETLVSLSVGENLLNISGDGLTIKNLSLENGEVSVNGNIQAIVYFDDSPKKKRFSFGKNR